MVKLRSADCQGNHNDMRLLQDVWRQSRGAFFVFSPISSVMVEIVRHCDGVKRKSRLGSSCMGNGILEPKFVLVVSFSSLFCLLLLTSFRFDNAPVCGVDGKGKFSRA